MANELKIIWGTPQTCINYSTDTSDTNFVGGTPTEFNNTNDAVVPYAPWASCTLEWANVSSATEGKTVDLYMVKKNVEGGTDDDTDAPSGTANNGGQYCGSFATATTTTSLQRRTIVISMEGVYAADFYLKNNLGVVMNNDTTACVLTVQPFTYKPI